MEDRIGLVTFVRMNNKYYKVQSQDETIKQVVLVEAELSKEQIEHIENNINSIYDLDDLLDLGYEIVH